jgi:glycine betaine transporter
MFKNPLLIVALALTGAVAVWGIVDTEGLATFAAAMVRTMFRSRGWFIMLTASVMLILCFWLAFSRYGRLKLGKDDDEPEFSTVSWLTMLFAAGMGVGLLYFASAEPISHYLLAREFMSDAQAATAALVITNFHWGLHAWAIYGVTALAIAYFGFRKGCPSLISAPLVHVFGRKTWTRSVGWMSDLLAIYAIAIGLGGSVAMGVFQVHSGIVSLFDLEGAGLGLALAIFVVLCLSYTLPLMVDLSKGMARMSNMAMGIALGLMVFVLLAGPTHFLMDGIVEAIGMYFSRVLPQGFRTYSFFDERVGDHFSAWTLTYMVWWLAWAPFVGVFIARISKGRTIRQFVLGVVLVPTVFSIFWFGVFGGMGFYEALRTNVPIIDVVKTDFNGTTFFLLDVLPLSFLTTAATVTAAFLFIITSVVSAAYVLAMFSMGGDLNPSTRVKLVWGAVLGALGLVMILSNSIDAVRSIIALAAMPFVFIVLLLTVCLLKALKREPR